MCTSCASFDVLCFEVDDLHIFVGFNNLIEYTPFHSWSLSDTQQRLRDTVSAKRLSILDIDYLRNYYLATSFIDAMNMFISTTSNLLFCTKHKQFKQKRV